MMFIPYARITDNHIIFKDKKKNLYQKEVRFKVMAFPTEINFKLWKEKPFSKQSPTDINNKIIIKK